MLLGGTGRVLSREGIIFKVKQYQTVLTIIRISEFFVSLSIGSFRLIQQLVC